MTKPGVFNILYLKDENASRVESPERDLGSFKEFSVMASRINYINVYSLYDEIDASVLKKILEEYNIPCMVKEIGFVFEDFSEEESAEVRIMVEEDNVDSAKRLISNAIEKGIISEQGRFKV